MSDSQVNETLARAFVQELDQRMIQVAEMMAAQRHIIVELLGLLDERGILPRQSVAEWFGSEDVIVDDSAVDETLLLRRSIAEALADVPPREFGAETGRERSAR